MEDAPQHAKEFSLLVTLVVHIIVGTLSPTHCAALASTFFVGFISPFCC